MEIILIIIAIYIIGLFFEKSDHDLMRDSSKLPPFTKRDSEVYFNNKFNKNHEKI